MKKLWLYLPFLLSAANASYIGAPIPDTCSYLPPNRGCILSDKNLLQSNTYLALDFLYWQAKMEGLEYAIENPNSYSFDPFDPPLGNVVQDMRLKEPHFDFDPGVRFTLGYHLPHDSWWALDASILYLGTSFEEHLHSDVDQVTFEQGGKGLIPIWISPMVTLRTQPGILTQVRFQNASASWDFQTGSLDLMLRHSLSLGSALSMKPAFGLKLATIQQRYTVQYQNANRISADGFLLNSKISMKNRSFNIGPQFALQTKWTLGNCWNLAANGSTALFGSSITIGRNETDTGTSDFPASPFVGRDLIRLNDQFWTFRPQTALALSLSYQDCYCRKDSVVHYGFSLGYEGQYFWKQNMFFRYVDGISLKALAVPAAENLILHGMTLSGIVDF